MKKIAFTLAEVLITLTVIGVITAVIVPVAIHSKPDENVLKFKKGHNTLYQTISTLINSDRYYLNGDLGISATGELLNSENYTTITNEQRDRIIKYYCNSFADVVTTKKKNCTTESTYTGSHIQQGYNNYAVPRNEIADSYCKFSAATVGEEIVTPDGIVYYESRPYVTFGYKTNNSGRYFGGSGFNNENGFDGNYKVVCMDIDGIPNGGSNNCDDIKDICPFGYGVRADGKIEAGKRALEWLDKSLQGEN